jgi:BCD family chlorophyll transporter-like MFS transporter
MLSTLTGAKAGPRALGWFGIVRIGLVQAALGSIVVLATSTINRVMVVELALPALLPGALVALHYAVQMLRPRLGYGSDRGQRRTPWIIGGMAVLALGGVGAAAAAAWMASNRWAGIALAVLAFGAIGVGVGACGTSLLVLLAKRVAAERRPAAATIVWLMMIAGFVVTTVLAGHFLEPFSFVRLLEVTGAVALCAMLAVLLAVWGLEGSLEGPLEQPTGITPTETSVAPPNTPAGGPAATGPVAALPFRAALREVWEEPAVRRLAIFVFVSMLAYSAEELILDPFSGAVFGFTPGQSTQLSGVLHGGVFAGMLFVGVIASWMARSGKGSLGPWMVGSCALSALALLGLAGAGLVGPGWPLKANVLALGAANGMFTVAAISSMMSLVGAGRAGREGVRMGVWGAAQGVAFGLGGISASGASDLAREFLAEPGTAYAVVFGLEALLFACAAVLARGLTGGLAGMRPTRAQGGEAGAGVAGAGVAGSFGRGTQGAPGGAGLVSDYAGAINGG